MTVLHEVDLWNRALARLGEVSVQLEAGLAVADGAAGPDFVYIQSTAHGLATDDLVLITGVVGLDPINRRVYRITRQDADVFWLADEDWTTWTGTQWLSGGTIQRLVPSKAASECYSAWAKIRDETLRAHPWNSTTKRTRLARKAAAKTITAATKASPCVLSIASHGYVAGDLLLIENVSGMVELNDRWYTVHSAPTAGTVAITVDSTTYTTYTTGGTATKALAPLVPDYGYAYRYTLPTDCDRALGPLEEGIHWEVEGREVLADGGITLPFRYGRRVVDVSTYDAQLVRVLAARLAVDVCEPISGSRQMRELVNAELGLAWQDAGAVDGKEQAPQELEQGDWILARL